ncbi:MAG: hypothetical protein QOF73_1040 [Thermomicrobiales bacterium]|nr:hypothetical protein [Thermomicrobiales bacterium]
MNDNGRAAQCGEGALFVSARSPHCEPEATLHSGAHRTGRRLSSRGGAGFQVSTRPAGRAQAHTRATSSRRRDHRCMCRRIRLAA